MGVYAHPVIKEIDGAKIILYYPPSEIKHKLIHLHVLDSTGEEVVYDLNLKQLAPKDVKDTKLISNNKLKKIKEWITKNRSNILEAFELAKKGKRITKIK